MSNGHFPDPNEQELGETTHVSRSRPTLEIPQSLFRRAQPRLNLLSVLTAVSGSTRGKTQIKTDDFTIGRSDEADLTIPDHSVSRKHAMIRRVEDDFIIEDLGSVNGTFVDGVPIVSCVLRSGDTIQFGRNLFYFDRLYVHVGESGMMQ